MKKIIHMSDLHVGYKDLGDRFLKIITNLKIQKREEAGDYVIIITGDLVENAHLQRDYSKVKEILDDLKRAGFDHVLLIPGNHDYGTGDYGDKKFVSIFKEVFYGDTKDYPRLDVIEGVAFLGLDSMAAELYWYDSLWAEGELGEEQLSRLQELLRTDEVRVCEKRVIYLHHHPFDARPFHELKDSRNLNNILTRAMAEGVSVDALLYGHNHAGEEHNGNWGIPHCYDAGSATQKSRPFYMRWLPWFKTNSSIREIDLGDDSAASSTILELI